MVEAGYGDPRVGEGLQPPPAPVQFLESPGFAEFLSGAGVSLAFSTYQAGKVILVGVNEAGRISIFERSFPRCMGLSVSGHTIWLSSLFQLWRLENFLDPGQEHQGYDALFVPVSGHTTGEIDIHDMTEGPDGQPVFVATRVNCLATIDARHSFVPIWTPPFIDAIVPEDRCHLNGAAFDSGRAAYVTCVATTNSPRGWSDRRRDGGVVLDVPSGETVAQGLSMPHSPRLYRNDLWLIQSGTGEFGRIDRATGRFEPVTELPGFARGLGFICDHAVIGVSGPRRDKTFEGLALNERLAARGQVPLCGIVVVSLDTGEIQHLLEIRGAITELYDVAVLPGFRRPMALGFRSEDIRYALRPAPFPPDAPEP
ncbi:MAG: TIGR03032 family protein [Pseudomonadota bacterium]